jgi:hypothetical protein
MAKFDFGRNANRGCKNPRTWVGKDQPTQALPDDFWVKVNADHDVIDTYKYNGLAWICSNPYRKYVVIKTADETVNNSTVLQDDNELYITFPFSGVFEITANLHLDANSDTPDMKIRYALTNVSAITRRMSLAPAAAAADGADATMNVLTKDV